MQILLEVSGAIFAAGWLVNGGLLAWQLFKILHTKNATGVSMLTFAMFCLLNLNSALYGVLTGNYWWLPGTLLGAISCLFIVIKTYQLSKADHAQS